MRAEVRPAPPELRREAEFRWVIPKHGTMRVPGVIFASEGLLPAATGDRATLQVENVAALPGIVRASFAMPDIHWGYGFPIGGVAATDPAEGGVVSPGGVGFDISCGVRLLLTPFDAADIRARVEALMQRLARRIPAGIGEGGIWDLDERQLGRVLRQGAPAAVEAGYGSPEDLEHCEDGGVLRVDSLEGVSVRAAARGRLELGSLGSGNHFLEVQEVVEVCDERVAARFGLRLGQVTVLIHTGSRGLGHQVCSDFVQEMQRAMPAYGLEVPDPQLAAVPVESPEGRRYLSAMAAAANFGRANRQVLTGAVRGEFESVFGKTDLPVVYDVSHNLAKLETHQVAGAALRLCVHRKGATRALPAGHPDLPLDYRDAGQPVIVPGSMGTASYVLVGRDSGAEAFFSSCHGAGRTMSRHQALRAVRGADLVDRLRARGVVIAARSVHALAEEAPEAYKDIDEVVRASEGAGLSRRVARLLPLAVLKG